jgi:hypothetical protein
LGLRGFLSRASIIQVLQRTNRSISFKANANAVIYFHACAAGVGFHLNEAIVAFHAVVEVRFLQVITRSFPINVLNPFYFFVILVIALTAWFPVENEFVLVHLVL